MSGAAAVAAVTATTLAALIGWVWARRVWPTRAIGDEVEYLDRTAALDPWAPHPFLRLPGVIWLVRWAGSERRARRTMQVLSVSSVAVLTFGVAATASWPVALATGCVLALLPDRLVLSAHIWPEMPLFLLHSFAVVALLAGGNGGMVALGAVGAVMALVRLDALVVVAAGALAAPSLLGAAAAVAPALVVLSILTVRNHRRYGIALPDDTLRFNWALARSRAGSERPLQEDIAAVYAEWTERSTPTRRVALLRLALDAADRAVRMVGADTFTTEVLLHPDSGAYCATPPPVRRSVARMSRWSFPLLATLAGAGIGVGVASPGPARALLLPLGAVWVAISAVHARTRFRASLWPALTVLAAIGLRALVEGDHRVAALVGLVVGASALVAPPRREHNM